MFVEFLGLPASGKSTLVKLCVQKLRAAGWNVGGSTQLDNLDASLQGYMWKHPAVRILNRFETVRSAHPGFLPLVDEIAAGNASAKAMLLGESVRHAIDHAHPDAFDFVIAEEGILHRAVYLINKNARNPFEMIDRLCDVMPVSDGFVYLDVDAEQSRARAIERLQARSKGRLNALQVQKRIERAHGDLDTLLRRKELAERAVLNLTERGHPVVGISTEQSMDMSGAEAVAGLLEIQQARKERASAVD